MSTFSIDWVDMTHAWMAGLYRASWQGAIGIGLVWCLCRLVGRAPPRVCCWLWRLVLVKMLLLTFWPGTIDLAWLPRPAIDGPVSVASDAVPFNDTPEQASSAAVPPGSRGPAQDPLDKTEEPASPTGANARGTTLYSVLTAAWALGFATVAALLIRRMRAARRWRKECVLVKDASILGLCETLVSELGVYQPPVLFVSHACESPVVFGALRTSVVLPAKLLERLSLKQLRPILRHELAHIRRGDLLWNWVGTAVWSLFFFHPLVWIALRELRLHQELACDDCALGARDVSPADYGTLLVELADQAQAPASMLVTVGVVESFEFLKRRLKAMSDVHYPARRIGPLSVSLLSLGVVVLLPWRVVAQAPRSNRERSAHVSATATHPSSDRKAALGATDRSKRPVLAAVSVKGFRIEVDNVRRPEGQGILRWVSTGFPIQANAIGSDRDGQLGYSGQSFGGTGGRAEPGGGQGYRAAGGSSGGGGGSGGGYAGGGGGGRSSGGSHERGGKSFGASGKPVSAGAGSESRAGGFGYHPMGGSAGGGGGSFGSSSREDSGRSGTAGEGVGFGGAGVGGSGGGAAGGGGGGSGGGVTWSGSFNTVVDLHVSGPGGNGNHLICSPVGRVIAQDDSGTWIDAPELPAHTRLELRDFDYPRGSGCTSVNLVMRNKEAKAIQSLVGDLLVAEARVDTAAFEGNGLQKASIQRLGGVTIRIENVVSTQEGIAVSLRISVPAGGDPIVAMRRLSGMHDRLRVVMEDSEGITHDFQSGGGGGGGGFASGAGGRAASSPTISYNVQFAPLPERVTVRRIVCTLTELVGPIQRVPFEFHNLPLP